MELEELGYWVCATWHHLRLFSSSAQNITEFEVTRLSGDLAILLNSIRGRDEIDQNEVIRLAKAHNLGTNYCLTQLLPAVRRLDTELIYIGQQKNGAVFIEEHILSLRQLYSLIGKAWESLGPSTIERGAVLALKHTFVMPRMRTEELTLLENEGLAPKDAELSLNITASFKVIQLATASKSQEPMVFNPYIWRGNNSKIAGAIKNLPDNERDSVRATLEITAKSQGVPLAALKLDKKLLSTAHSIGLLDIVEVNTADNARQEFVFTPHLNTHPEMSLFADDLLNDVRAVLACFTYGEHFSRISRLGGVDREKTIRMLRKLLDNSEAGDATAIGFDYTLLEERGIITVVPTLSSPGNRYAMVLLRREPVQIALKAIEESVNAESTVPLLVSKNNSDPRQVFYSPEATRFNAQPSVGELPAETAEARLYYLRKIRQEDF